MAQTINNNLERKLKEFVGKRVIIIQDGFLKAKYHIYKFEYSIIHELLDIIDEESKNYVNINLNQISKIEINQKNIALYLDNDTIICLNI